MVNKRSFAIAPLNIAEDDLRVLKSLSYLTTNQPRSYSLGIADQTPEIYLVDIDNPDSVWEWNAHRNRHKAPAVLICKTGVCPLGDYVIKRPVIPSRLLAKLNEVTEKECNFSPAEAIA